MEMKKEINGIIYKLINDYYTVVGCSPTCGEKVVILNEIEGIPVESISSYAFLKNANIKEVKLPDNIKYIGLYAFAQCMNLTNINLDKVNVIDNYAFACCYSLKSVDISTLIIINAYTFACCSNLEEVKTSKKLFSVDKYAFLGCRNLRKINLNKYIDVAYSYEAFLGCESLLK